MIRLFASDLDGTLMNGLHRADPVIVGAVRRVTREGRHFAIATGRFMRKNDEFGFGGLPIEAIAGNGALIYDAEGQLVRYSQIDPALVEEVLRAFPQIPFDCMSRHHMYTPESKEARLESIATRSLARALRARARFYKQRNTWVYDVPIERILDHKIVKLNCRLIEQGLRRELKAFLAEHEAQLANAAFDGLTFEITRADVNKGEAVAWLADRLGIGQDEVAVYGDGGNDVAMLERYAPYGHSFATHGACADAHAAAAQTIGSNLAYAVPRHMLAELGGASATPRSGRTHHLA